MLYRFCFDMNGYYITDAAVKELSEDIKNTAFGEMSEVDYYQVQKDSMEDLPDIDFDAKSVFFVFGKYYTEIEAADSDSATQLAYEKAEAADFGALATVDICLENYQRYENGELIEEEEFSIER